MRVIVRTEAEIRADLAQQLAEIVRAFEQVLVEDARVEDEASWNSA